MLTTKPINIYPRKPRTRSRVISKHISSPPPIRRTLRPSHHPPLPHGLQLLRPIRRYRHHP